jgi:hypothetical protein
LIRLLLRQQEKLFVLQAVLPHVAVVVAHGVLVFVRVVVRYAPRKMPVPRPLDADPFSDEPFRSDLGTAFHLDPTLAFVTTTFSTCASACGVGEHSSRGQPRAAAAGHQGSEQIVVVVGAEHPERASSSAMGGRSVHGIRHAFVRGSAVEGHRGATFGEVLVIAKRGSSSANEEKRKRMSKMKRLLINETWCVDMADGAIS